MLVAIAGAAGALCRYGAQHAAVSAFGSGVPGTMAVNISGAFLLGLLVALTEGRFDMPASTRVVLGTGFRIALVGVAVGALVAIAGAGIVRPMLYEVSPRDPAVFGCAIAVLVAAAGLASLGPARRASRADPLTSLRTD